MRAENWSGLITNASPYAIPPGAAVEQVNFHNSVPGQLASRGGMRRAAHVGERIGVSDITSVRVGDSVFLLALSGSELHALETPALGEETSEPIVPLPDAGTDIAETTYLWHYEGHGYFYYDPGLDPTIPGSRLVRLLHGGSAATQGYIYELNAMQPCSGDGKLQAVDGGRASTASYPPVLRFDQLCLKQRIGPDGAPLAAPDSPTGVSLTTQAGLATPNSPEGVRLSAIPSAPTAVALASIPKAPSILNLARAPGAPTDVGLIGQPGQLNVEEVFVPDAPTGLGLVVDSGFGTPSAPTDVGLIGQPSQPNVEEVFEADAPTGVELASSPSTPTGVELTAAPSAPTGVDLTAAPSAPTEVVASSFNVPPDQPTGVELTAAPSAPTGVALKKAPSAPTEVVASSFVAAPDQPTGVGLITAPAPPTGVGLGNVLLRATGWNYWGQLGNGADGLLEPAGGQLKTTGWNYWGQLGNGTDGLLEPAGGQLKTTGWNYWGQLGNGTDGLLEPAGGQLKTTGWDFNGQLGDG